MNTLIIGSKGYIGSSLMEYIEADGIDMENAEDWNIAGYDTIILLAGHSSMPMGRDDPDGCWKNNVVRFRRLLAKLPVNKRLIYASSASVYNGIKATPTETCVEFRPMNMYDLSKYIIDQLALMSEKHIYGLRFCTINGYSPTLRVDLMLNKMVEDAKNKGVVTIKNGDLTRPILGMHDLLRAIKTIVDSPDDHRGIYNLCSLNGHTVRQFAEAVTKKFGGVIQDLGDEPHYVYGADTTKFEKTYHFKFEETLDSILNSLEEEPERRVIRV